MTDSNQFMILQDQVENFGTELEKLSTELFKDNATFAIQNPASPYISNTAIELGNELNKIIQDATVKFIMGTASEEDWNQAVDKWLQGGGSKIIEEINADYAKSANK